MTELESLNKRIPNKKWRLFIDELFKCNMNQAKAYQNVYGGSYENARARSTDLVANSSISKEIERRLQENAMSANEVISRLADEARNDISFFLDKDGNLDLEKVREKGYLIKSLTWTRYGPKIELYDAQTAKVHIGKALGIFTDNVDHTGEVILIVKYGTDNKPKKTTS